MKILTVFTGGTIGSAKTGGVISPDEKNSYKLLEMYSKKDKTVEFTTVQPFNILSENMNGKTLTALYDCISSFDLSKFDGVIVAHGTDTLQYTAAYLSYAFGLCRTPIVLVSANYPLENRHSNGFKNFCGAVELIKHGKGRGVFVSYTNSPYDVTELHRASRILPHSPYEDYIFSIADNSVYAIYSADDDFEKCRYYNEVKDKVSLADCTELKEQSDVMYVRPYVGMAFPKIADGTKAVLLEGYHSGTLNTSGIAMHNFCKTTKEMGIPVFLTGAQNGFYYESKLLFDELNIKVLPPASPIAMYMKLWMLKEGRLNDVYLPCGGDFYQSGE